MLGAAIGDIAGSRFEFDNCRRTDFKLFHPQSDYTDDSICTAAVAQWLLDGGNPARIMQDWCRRYPHPAGAYGTRFARWIHEEPPAPYGSWGNGAAMRVSAAGWAFPDLESTLRAAEQSAAITHNHPEGIKGAQAVAAAIFWARHGESKTQIREQITQHFGYDLSASCDQIRPYYQFDESCQGTVPQALAAFFEAQDFEHAVRLAVSLGGDSDTLAAITASVAAAAHPIPQAMRERALAILPRDIGETLLRAGDTFGRR